MQLKPEIVTVLNSLGADETEISGLVEYFSARLVQAHANLEQIDDNIASLQTQRVEAQTLIDTLTTAIGKFVIVE
ncbi:hypothetical protein EOA32_00985 [Mesorhizobium sp. M1A.F.Ca.ET.072.01.1.1]|uniref:hypothetical protein n=1 Tax=Mesorhizobium sp. M1A.F.Ca.ET.072.01.1.1 TaxID=2496753 RepID=UPI000FD23DEC|nr:hypothetical protein [Mesorhizobium sp. M1A.F.Ca.ET.072.01.1.1]RUW55624.1 hypothetical protein EOA32_00985 [Mesorhizobium sp. M1A.F.Ca.ET.072.01.1.1]